MLAVFYGNDTIKVRRQALQFAESKAGEGVLEVVDVDTFMDGLLPDLAGGVSLFGGAQTYVLDMPSDDSTFFGAMMETASMLQNSVNTFVVIEGALLADSKKKLSKYAEPFEEYKGGKVEWFNSFSLADALAKKDKKQLWVLWHTALLNGISPEEISGILWWQLKTLRLARIGTNAEAVGLKDFPYQKAKRALAKFSEGELEQLSRELLQLIHDSRLGRQDIGVSLERWILTI